jgi:hypothetical protein
VLDRAGHLGQAAEGPIFNPVDAPKPTPTMRIVPDI